MPAMDTCEPWRLVLGRAAALSADVLRDWGSALERPTCVQEVHLSAAYSKGLKDTAAGQLLNFHHSDRCCRHASIYTITSISLHAEAACLQHVKLQSV